MIWTILLAVFFVVAPAGVLWACRKVKFLGKIGPVLLLYILGVIVANIHVLPESAASLQDSLSSILVPLAIPMMLFACNFKNFSAKQTLYSFIIGVLSVVAVVLGGYFLFKNQLGPEGPIMAASLTGQYTGGAGNLAAVKMMLNLDNTTFVLLSTCNLIVSFFYLMFLMSGGIKLSRKFVGVTTTTSDRINKDEYFDDNPYKDFAKKKSVIQLLKVLGSAAVITVVSLLFAKLFKEDYFMIVLILTLTTISIILSFCKEVKTWDKSYDAGMYLIYIFCLVMASMADLSKLDFKSSLFVLLFQAIIIFGSFFLTLLFAKIFKLDADSAVITSDTLINSPICVPMIAASMKNRNVIITGITNGIAGYAVGNYLGFIIYQILT